MPEPAPPPRPRAVICDADAVSSRHVARILDATGLDATECHTGSACEILVAEQHPSLVVVALLLPDTDGLEMVRRLRATGDGGPARAPHVVMVSAVHARDWALEAGAHAFLPKPVARQQLTSLVEALVGQPQL